MFAILFGMFTEFAYIDGTKISHIAVVKLLFSMALWQSVYNISIEFKSFFSLIPICSLVMNPSCSSLKKISQSDSLYMLYKHFFSNTISVPDILCHLFTSSPLKDELGSITFNNSE